MAIIGEKSPSPCILPPTADIASARKRNLSDQSVLTCDCFSEIDAALHPTRRRQSSATLINTLASLPSSLDAQSDPLSHLSFLLDSNQHEGWPVFDLILCYNRIWHSLPEEAKVPRRNAYTDLLNKTMAQVKYSYGSMAELLYDNTKPAIHDPATKKIITHRTISDFVHNFHLPVTASHGSKKPVVVIALPNGPLLGLTCIAVSTYYTAAPILTSSGPEQFRSDVEQTRADAVLVQRADLKKLDLEAPWVAQLGIKVLIVDQKEDLTFNVTPLTPIPKAGAITRTPNNADDIALILFTSGTSGKKKVVPLTTHTIVSGVAFVIESWGLTEEETCLNMMPLNHV